MPSVPQFQDSPILSHRSKLLAALALGSLTCLSKAQGAWKEREQGRRKESGGEAGSLEGDRLGRGLTRKPEQLQKGAEAETCDTAIPSHCRPLSLGSKTGHAGKLGAWSGPDTPSSVAPLSRLFPQTQSTGTAGDRSRQPGPGARPPQSGGLVSGARGAPSASRSDGHTQLIRPSGCSNANSP